MIVSRTGIWSVDTSLYTANGMPPPADSRGILTSAPYPPPTVPVLGYPLQRLRASSFSVDKFRLLPRSI